VFFLWAQTPSAQGGARLRLLNVIEEKTSFYENYQNLRYCSLEEIKMVCQQIGLDWSFSHFSKFVIP
jgi:hypothetical protein